MTQQRQSNIIKNMGIACTMAVLKFLSKQSLETKPSQFYKVSLLNWLLL